MLTHADSSMTHQLFPFTTSLLSPNSRFADFGYNADLRRIRSLLCPAGSTIRGNYFNFNFRTILFGLSFFFFVLFFGVFSIFFLFFVLFFGVFSFLPHFFSTSFSLVLSHSSSQS
jgi:hypothetical protein